MRLSGSRILVLGAGLVVLAAFVVGAVILVSRQGQQPSAPVNFHQSASTRSYKFLLAVSPPQSMYTPQQVAEQHPTNGEVMFSGTMTMPSGMSGMSGMTGDAYPAGWYHVEVHIYDRQTGQVASNASPVISIRDDGTGRTVDLPIVTMQGIVAGPSDFHYGNNQQLTAGHQYTLTAQVQSEVAEFHFHL